MVAEPGTHTPGGIPALLCSNEDGLCLWWVQSLQQMLALGPHELERFCGDIYKVLSSTANPLKDKVRSPSASQISTEFLSPLPSWDPYGVSCLPLENRVAALHSSGHQRFACASFFHQGSQGICKACACIVWPAVACSVSKKGLCTTDHTFTRLHFAEKVTCLNIRLVVARTAETHTSRCILGLICTFVLHDSYQNLVVVVL